MRDRFAAIGRELADGSGQQSIAFALRRADAEAHRVHRRGRRPLRLHARRPAAAGESEKLTVGATEITRALEFDGDRLQTKTGPFTIERNGPAGAVSKITDGKLALSYAYDGNGRPATRTLTVGGTERFFQKLTFDKTGRAEKREERVEGAADTLGYGYDGAGQLLTVKRGSDVLEDHAYDGNGNRLSGGAAYDDQDRLTTRAGVAYTWDADGFLKTRGNDTFTYSRSGELLSANRRDVLLRRASAAGPRRARRSTCTATPRTRSRSPRRSSAAS